MKAYLIQIDARDSAGDPMTMCFASHDDAGLCHHSGETWWPAIARLPSLSYDFFDGGFRGDISNPSGSFSVSMQAFPDMASAIWSDAAFTLYWMDFDDSVIANLATLFVGRVRSQPRFSGGRADIDFESDDRWLDEPLLDTYAGTGGVEGPDGLEGAVKPLLLGSPRFAPGVLIDAVDNIYQLSAYGAIQGVEAVYDRLSSLGASTGDHASLAALLAATIANGSWATCLALGLVRLGAPPDGQVCFHVSGDNVGGWSRLPGALISRIATIAGGVVSAASLTAISVSRPYNLSVALTDQITARELIQSIAASIKAVAGVDWSGNLFVVPLAITSAVKALNSDGSALPAIAEVSQLPVDPPFWRLATEAEKTWVIHGDADIAYQYNFRGAYATARVYRLDDVVSIDDGSTWRFVGAVPLAGSMPSDANANWERRSAATVVDFTNVTGTESLLADIAEALALAAARGKIWTGATFPSLAESNIGDTWIAPDGVFYDRVAPVGILLDTKAIVLGGFRPVFAWTRSVNQPLEATIATANDASATANAAADRIEAYDNDDILDISEKRSLVVEDAQLEGAYQQIILSAAAVGVSSTALTTARTSYRSFRDAISPAWNDTTQDSPVTRNSLDTVVNGFADAIEVLRKSIEAAIKGLADAAQSAAATAQATADAAEAGAAQANTILANIANDDLLTPDEKPEVILKRDVIVNEQAGIEASADDYGITTEKTAYTDAVTALTDYLATLTSPVLWSSLAGNTTIVGTTFRTKFADVYAARQVLLNKIAAVAAVRIENIGDDGILSRNEKLQLVREVAAILANHAALDAKATALGTAGTEQTAAQASIDALDAYLATLSPAWNDSSQDTAIVRATFDGKFSDVADDVAALQAAIQGIPGADGSPGAPGLNSAAVFLYRRSATTPDLPSTTSTYTFATGVLTGFDNSWSTTVPAGTDPLYITTASASGTGATDTIAAGEWASPTILARDGLIGEDGPPGDNGIDGLNNAVVFIYQRKSTEPSLPSATATYAFATGAITGLDNGWQATVPAGTDPLYVSTATASAAGTTDTIASGEWAAVTVMAQDGDKGNYIDILFYPPGPEPATPFGTSPSGWTNQPEEGGFYSRAERRASDGAIVTTWSVPVKLGAFRNRGAWNGTDTYYPDDTVQYSGGTYASSTVHSNSAPSGTDQDNANWFVIAAPGAAGTPATPPSAFSDTIDLTTQTGPVNLRTLADAAGYTGMSDATITFNVPTGVTITGGTSGTGGLNGITTGTWPSGYTIALDLSVTGNVYGGGGKGGNGESGDNGGTNGLNGGDAIYALEDIDIIVNSGGQVKGGGGGGGGGKGTTTTPGGEPIFFGGGGGGGGAPNGAGGIAGYSDVAPAASDGSAGTTGGGGAGGALGNATYSSAGGNGGGFATAGTNVTSGTNGGSAGYAIRKNGKTVNVTNNGTITGTEG